MKGRGSITILFLAICALGHAQVTVSRGSPHKETGARLMYYFASDTDVVSLKIRGRKAYLLKAKVADLTVEKTSLFKFPFGAKIHMARKIGRRYFVIYDLPNADKNALRAREFDVKRCTFSDHDLTLVSGSQWRHFGASFAEFNFDFSRNDSMMLVTSRWSPSNFKDKQLDNPINFQVFDQDLSLVWNNKMKIPYPDELIARNCRDVDSNGNVYFGFKAFRSTDVAKDDTCHQMILKFQKGAAEASMIELRGKDVFPGRLILTEDGNKVVSFTGFYEGKPFRGRYLRYFRTAAHEIGAVGIVTFGIDKHDQVREYKTYRFSELITNPYNGAESGRHEETVRFLTLNDVEAQKDGGLVIRGEQVYYKNHGRIGSIKTLVYHDLLIARISAENEVSWIKRLPKIQESMLYTFTGGMSYFYFFDGQRHKLLFLDNVKNINLTPGTSPIRYTDGTPGVVMAYVIDDASGEMNKTTVPNVRDINSIKARKFSQRWCQAAANTLVFEAFDQDHHGDVFVKVNFDNR